MESSMIMNKVTYFPTNHVLSGWIVASITESCNRDVLHVENSGNSLGYTWKSGLYEYICNTFSYMRNVYICMDEAYLG